MFARQRKMGFDNLAEKIPPWVRKNFAQDPFESFFKKVRKRASKKFLEVFSCGKAVWCSDNLPECFPENKKILKNFFFGQIFPLVV